jgi:hypothetical protein
MSIAVKIGVFCNKLDYSLIAGMECPGSIRLILKTVLVNICNAKSSHPVFFLNNLNPMPSVIKKPGN